MDGCQLCNYIKTNMEYSHLPVLLLTAAVGMKTRLQTLEVGADGYIEKPFPIALLRANIASLFKNRDIAYKQFTDSPLTHFNSVNSSKMDEEFMEKLHVQLQQAAGQLRRHPLCLETDGYRVRLGRAAARLHHRRTGPAHRNGQPQPDGQEHLLAGRQKGL